MSKRRILSRENNFLCVVVFIVSFGIITARYSACYDTLAYKLVLFLPSAPFELFNYSVVVSRWGGGANSGENGASFNKFAPTKLLVSDKYKILLMAATNNLGNVSGMSREQEVE